MRLKVLAIVVLLVVAGGALVMAMGGLTPATTAGSTLLTAAASVADVTDEIAATGTVEATDQYDLAFGDPAGPSMTWPVADVKVAVGDRVTSGQVLATAGTADLETQITEAARAAKSAALQLKQATTDHDDATTTASRRQTQVSLYNAQTADERAKADLAALKALRPGATLTAPADGVVTAITITAGDVAPAGAAITMISSDLRISTSVVESDIASIKVGQEATVSVAALDASLRGRVSSIDPVAAAGGSNGVVSFAVKVELDSPPASLRPGMSADITIVAASATNVLSIPSRALSGSAGSYAVRVVAADGSAATRQVEVGLVTSSLAEIKSGLQAGELVVTGTSSSQSSVNAGGGGGAFPGGGGTIVRGGGGFR
jgi:membrane fusion protein, macrolide-specific efflux system